MTYLDENRYPIRKDIVLHFFEDTVSIGSVVLKQVFSFRSPLSGTIRTTHFVAGQVSI